MESVYTYTDEQIRKADALTTPLEIARAAIFGAFVWDDTVEGLDYWLEVTDKLKAYLDGNKRLGLRQTGEARHGGFDRGDILKQAQAFNQEGESNADTI